MITQQPESAALGKHGRFVVKRAIFEVEHQPAGYAVSTDALDQVAVSESLAGQCAQHEKSME